MPSECPRQFAWWLSPKRSKKGLCRNPAIFLETALIFVARFNSCSNYGYFSFLISVTRTLTTCEASGPSRNVCKKCFQNFLFVHFLLCTFSTLYIFFLCAFFSLEKPVAFGSRDKNDTRRLFPVLRITITIQSQSLIITNSKPAPFLFTQNTQKHQLNYSGQPFFRFLFRKLYYPLSA